MNIRILMKKLFTHFIMIVLGALAPMVVYEAGYRLDQWVRKGVPLFTNPKNQWDAELGWAGTEQVLGKPDGPVDILVLGDSFTEGMGVSPREMWYAKISAAFPDQKLVAYGGRGYGTLQELLVLRRYLTAGHPRLIILQLCSNDFINNFRPLEEKSYLQRPPAPRPYLEKQGIRIAYPRPFSSFLLPAISYSRAAYHLNSMWDTRLAQEAAQGKLRSVEFDISDRSFNFRPYRRAISITQELLSQFKAAATPSRLIFMLADDFEPNTEAFKRIAAALQLEFYVPTHGASLPPSFRLPDGAHYSPEGNAFLGTKIVSLLQNEAPLNNH